VDELTKVYLSKKFREYYSKANLTPPPDFEKREWAFVPFEKLPDFFMQRHISFDSPEELKGYILSTPPAHVFYSSACYLSPKEPMEKKGWLYADLIFDIDADHLPLRPGTPMSEAIEIAKKEIVYLSEILESDFGIEKRKIKIVFSGGRGYHLHVYQEEFRCLGSPERREIVDYLSINSFDVFSKGTQMMRVRKCFLNFIKELKKRGLLEKFIKSHGIKKDVVKKIERGLDIIISDKNISRSFILGNYNLKKVSKSKKFEELCDKVLNFCISKASVHIDAPVTADVKRLIRFPGSIHGKSGLKTMEIDLNSIDEFDPFTDAIAFEDEKIKLTILPEKDVRVQMGGEEFRFKAGEKVVAPEFVAVHLLCRGVARYGH